VLNDGGAESPKAAALCKYMKFEMKNGFLLGADPIDGQDLAFTPMGGDCCCLEFAAAVQVIAYRLAVEQGRDLFAPHDNRVMNGYFNGHESL
jgi:hypothetical protein